MFGGDFGWGQYIFRVYYANKNLSCPFHSHGGVGQGGWQEVRLDEAASHLPYWEASPDLVLGCPLCWSQLVVVSGGIKLYYGSSILIKIHPALSAATGGWDGVDAKQMHLDVARLHLPFWETSPGLISQRRGTFNSFVLAHF